MLLRLLKTHRDGLKAQEILSELQVGQSTFYTYIAQLRGMTFNIICRTDGRYVLILDKRAEKMIVDYFPDMLVSPDRRNFKAKEPFVRFSNIYYVYHKINKESMFFMDAESLVAVFPRVTKNMIYNSRGKFENREFRIQSGPLLGYAERGESKESK